MDQVSMAWMLASILLIIVLLYSWRMLHSFGRAWITMLLVGKLIAGIYYLTGLDKPMLYLYFRNGVRLTITVAEAVFLTFLFTLIGTIMVVVYGKIIPEDIRKALNPDGGGV